MFWQQLIPSPTLVIPLPLAAQQLPQTSGSICSLLLLVSCLAYSFTLKMEVLSSSETPSSLQTTQCYNSEDCSLQEINDFVKKTENMKCSRKLMTC
jgi:hypothetical protein